MPLPTRRSARAVPLLLAGLALPAAAHGANAPSVTYAPPFIDGASRGISPLGIAPDAKEIIFNGIADETPGYSQAIVRDITTGKMTRLFPWIEAADGVSIDLKRVLLHTGDALDPADTNGTTDSYVLDRTTGQYLLASRASGGGPATGSGVDQLSGDGNTVVYDNGSTSSPQVLRYNFATRTSSVVGPGTLVRHGSIGRTGRSVVTSAGLVSPSGTFPVPPNPRTYGDLRSFVSSPDGSAMGVYSPEGGMAIINTTTGVSTPVPGNISPILATADGGGSLVGSGAAPSGTPGVNAGVVVRVTTAGVSTQLGGTIPFEGNPSVLVISENLAFVADQYKISAVGSVPLPQLPPPPALDYVKWYPGCSSGGIFAPAVRPSLVLGSTAIPGATTPRKPVKADVLVVADDTGVVTNQFTFSAGQRHTLNAGWGDYSYMVKVYFSDSTTSRGTKSVTRYIPIANGLGSGNGCKSANGM